MDYEILIGSATRKVSLSRGAGGEENFEFKASGVRTTKKILLVRNEPEKLLLSIEDRMYSISHVRKTSNSLEFILNGDLVKAALAGKRFQEVGSVASVSETVTSNFPAKVVKILASKNSKMKEGETILVLEAMKMEAQVKSPRDCVVLEIFVKEGEMVLRGAKLARLKFE